MRGRPTFPLALLALALAGTAMADDGRSGPRFASFTGFAGSEANLQSLVNGLRHDAPVTLTSATGPGTPQTVTFDPPTRPLGFGNIRHALVLSRAELSAAGISNPTPQQIQAAMMGGTVTTADGRTVTLQGVLQLRSQGLGWGEIRHALNLPPTAFSNASHGGAGITTALGTPPRGAAPRTRGRELENEVRGREAEMENEARGRTNQIEIEHRGGAARPAVVITPQANSSGIVTAAGTPAAAALRSNSGRGSGGESSGHGRGGR